MKYKIIDTVEKGNILAMTVFDDKCRTLLRANTIISDTNIQRLKQLGFEGLYVYEEHDTNTYKQLLSDDTRQKALMSLKEANVDDCLYIANEITNEILENPDVLYELKTICAYDNRTYIHCINVAILSVMIGIDMKMTKDELYELSKAALLHDIGKTAIDEVVLNKKEKLTDEEYALMKQHTNFGYDMLKNNINVSDNVRNGIRFHHENEDGSGYPLGLTTERIPLIAKIIHVADVYDAMISKRSYKEKINPADVLEYMMGNTHMFNISVVMSLMHCAVLYPIGTEVTLSDNTTGIITKNTRNYPQRPMIKLKNGQIIDLMVKLDVTIIKLNN